MGRRQLLRRIALWLGAIAVAAGAVWVLFFSQFLVVDAEGIVVEGVADYVDADGVDLVVADTVGIPLPRLDTVGLREDLLEVQGVGDASVSRSWPHGLAVSITARTPVAAVPGDAGNVLLDEDGVVVATVDVVPDDLPAIEIPTDDDSARARSMRSALVVLNTLPDTLRNEVSEVSAQTQDNVVTTMRDGTEIEWGNAERVELKIAVVEELQSAEDSADATTFDVSSPTRPITRQ